MFRCVDLGGRGIIEKDILYSHTFFWTDDNNIRVTNLKDFSVVFLARDLLTKMLTKFTILNDTDKIMMVMRPYQPPSQIVMRTSGTLRVQVKR